jgi:hypothetical protein
MADHRGRRSSGLCRMQSERTTVAASLSVSKALRYTPLWCVRFNPRFPANPPESQLNRACRLARRGRKSLSTKRGGRITRRGTERFLAVAKAAEGFSECPANSSDGTMRPLREGERWQEKAAGNSLRKVHAHGRSAPEDGGGERASRNFTSLSWSLRGHGGPRPAEERDERSFRDV